MTARFAFQRNAVEETEGLVLNVGCNEDPAGLKDLRSGVINIDIEETDSHMGRPNRVDMVFDAAKDAWPFTDGEADLVVLGDILEHMREEHAIALLSEARRVAAKLCVTVPKDDRPGTLDGPELETNPYMFHRVVVDAAYLEHLLGASGWSVDEWRTVDYDFVPEGYLVRAS